MRQELYVGTPTNNLAYELIPSWSDKWVEVSDYFALYQCGKTYINLVRGGSSWDLEFNVCQGSGF